MKHDAGVRFTFLTMFDLFSLISAVTHTLRLKPTQTSALLISDIDVRASGPRAVTVQRRPLGRNSGVIHHLPLLCSPPEEQSHITGCKKATNFD